MINQKVLVVCQRPPYPPNKGEKLRTYYQIKFLVDAGYQVYVACPTETDEAMAELAQLEQLMLSGSVSSPIGNGAIKKASAFLTGKSISESYFYSRELQTKIDALVTEKSIGSVLVTASSLVNYVTRLPVKKFVDFMDLDSDKWNQYASTANPVMKYVYQRESHLIEMLEKQAVSVFEECYLISNNEIELLTTLLGRTPANVKKVANGISADEFHPPAVARREEINGDAKLLFVGVMDYKPNEDAVIWFCENVWPTLRQTMPSAQFSIVGMSPSNDVKALAKLPGVVVTGKVPSVLPYFHDADVFVAPFRLARGVQNKILQAFACGLPVVTSPMGLEGIEGIESTECVAAIEERKGVTEVSKLSDQPKCPAVTPKTPQGYITNILAICKNNPQREAMSQAGIQLINKNYAWESVLNGFMQTRVRSEHESED